MKVIGHKGAGKSAPENTRSALQNALRMGVDAVEVDIWPTLDRQFVLFHDAHLSRLTEHSGWTTALTSDELLALELEGTSSSDDVGKERVLLLEEALDILSGDVELVLELKRTRHQPDQFKWVEKRLYNILRGAGAINSTLVVSFDHRSLLDLRETAPEARIGMLYAGEWLSLWSEVTLLEPQALVSHWAQTTADLVDSAHDRKLEVLSWAADHGDLMEHLMKIGVDGIITDYPRKLLELLDRSDLPVEERVTGGS